MQDEPIEVRDHRVAGWFWLDNEIVDVHGHGIGVYGIAVYCCLCRHADNRSQKAWPGVAGIATRLGTGKHQVVKAVRVLEEAGLVEVARRPGQGSVYTLRSVKIGGAGEAPVSPPTGAGEAPGGAGEAPVAVPEKHRNKTHEQDKRTTPNPGGGAFSQSLRRGLGEIGMSDPGIVILATHWSEDQARRALAWVITRQNVHNKAGYLLKLANGGKTPDDFIPLSGPALDKAGRVEMERGNALRCWELKRQPCKAVLARQMAYSWCIFCEVWQAVKPEEVQDG